MSAIIGTYDDHRNSASEDGGYPTVFLCKDCAEERGADVTYLDKAPAGAMCEDCGRMTEEDEKAEQSEIDAFIANEPYGKDMR